MNFKTKITTGFATAAAAVGMLTNVAFADTTVTVTDTGAFSGTGVTVSETNSNTVSQGNVMMVSNVVSASSNTGGNSSSFNVGDSSVTTGNATTTVTNITRGGDNVAEVNDCGCPEGDTTVRVNGTGPFSWTKINISKAKTSTVNQGNVLGVSNVVSAKSNTGKNKASFNVGGGTVNTSAARTTVTNRTVGGSNLLVPSSL